MNKILTRLELDQIEEEIKKISAELDWLDPNIAGEERRITAHEKRLEELKTILLTSLKNHRIEKSGLKVIQ